MNILPNRNFGVCPMVETCLAVLLAKCSLEVHHPSCASLPCDFAHTCTKHSDTAMLTGLISTALYFPGATGCTGFADRRVSHLRPLLVIENFKHDQPQFSKIFGYKGGNVDFFRCAAFCKKSLPPKTLYYTSDGRPLLQLVHFPNNTIAFRKSWTNCSILVSL